MGRGSYAATVPRVAVPTRARTAASVAVAAVLGVVTGTLGSFFQSAVLDTERVRVPWGVAAGLLLTAVAVAHGVRTGGAVGGASAGVGWFVAVGLLSSRRPEGDLVVTASVLGYVWLLGGALTVVAVIAVHAIGSFGRGTGLKPRV